MGVRILENTIKKDRKDYFRNYAKKNSKKRSEASKEWLAQHPNYQKNRMKNSKNKEKHAHSMRKYRYGITKEEYNNLLLSQSNKCAICEIKFGNGIKIVVDHNHKTDKVRGLLCSNCNFAIGLVKEDVKVLSSAISYINHHSFVNK